MRLACTTHENALLCCSREGTRDQTVLAHIICIRPRCPNGLFALNRWDGWGIEDRWDGKPLLQGWTGRLQRLRTGLCQVFALYWSLWIFLSRNLSIVIAQIYIYT